MPVVWHSLRPESAKLLIPLAESICNEFVNLDARKFAP